MAGLLHLLVGELHQPLGPGLGLAGAAAHGALAARGDLAIGLLRQLAHLALCHIARHDQDGVFRRVEAPVIGQRILAAEILDLVHPADDGLAIGMMGEEGGLHCLVELGGGVGIRAHAALFQHHVALGGHHLVGEDEVGHAVGLEAHHDRQMLLGDALEIGGVVVRGEGVLLPAQLGHHLGEGALLVVAGALEHEMLKEMGDARLAERIIRRTVAIPDHMGDDWRAMVGDHHDFHTVGKLEMSDVRTGGMAGGRGLRRQGSGSCNR